MKGYTFVVRLFECLGVECVTTQEKLAGRTMCHLGHVAIVWYIPAALLYVVGDIGALKILAYRSQTYYAAVVG